MSKYIDTDKLIEAIEEIKKAEYENCGGVNAKTGVLQEVQELITSFQQEQSEVDLEEAYKSYMESRKDDLSGNAVTINMKDLARHFYTLGLNLRKK